MRSLQEMDPDCRKGSNYKGCKPRTIHRYRFQLFVITLLLLAGSLTVWASEQPRDVEQPHLQAPGGIEMDFLKNIAKCYGSDAKPAEASWTDTVLTANYFEYDRSRQLVRAKGHVRVVQKQDNDSLISESASLEWDRLDDRLELTGNPHFTFDGWKIDCARLEGRVNKGLFTFYGPVQGNNHETSLQAGEMILDRGASKLYLRDNPVVTQGKNRFTAAVIVYDLKTKKAYSESETTLN